MLDLRYYLGHPQATQFNYLKIKVIMNLQKITAFLTTIADHLFHSLPVNWHVHRPQFRSKFDYLGR